MESFHRSYLVGYIADASQAYGARLHALAGMFTLHGLSAPAATTAGQMLIDNAVNTQASTLAYEDGFLVMAVAMLLSAPTVLLLKRGVRPAPGQAGAQQVH
jgi:hypothetical protein